jgi:predicted alpha/beta hydrolase
VIPRPVDLRAPDGRKLAGHWFSAIERRAVMVMNGATGFPQAFYFKLGQYAAERGFDTFIYDYRGMGLSASGKPAEETACMSYWRWENAPFRYLAWWFWRVHGPLMIALKGYIPTGGGWAGLPLPRRVYEEWRRWCLRPEHFGPDLGTYLADNCFAEVRAPVLSVGFTDDPIATPRTIEAMNRFFTNVQRESRWFTPADAQSRRIGHEGFFAVRHRDTLWRPVFDWIDGKLGAGA